MYPVSFFACVGCCVLLISPSFFIRFSPSLSRTFTTTPKLSRLPHYVENHCVIRWSITLRVLDVFFSFISPRGSFCLFFAFTTIALQDEENTRRRPAEVAFILRSPRTDKITYVCVYCPSEFIFAMNAEECTRKVSVLNIDFFCWFSCRMACWYSSLPHTAPKEIMLDICDGQPHGTCVVETRA